MAHHVYRPAPMGTRVLIYAHWCKSCPARNRLTVAQSNYYHKVEKVQFQCSTPTRVQVP